MEDNNVIHAHWELDDKQKSSIKIRCSHCFKVAYFPYQIKEKYPICPYCAAIMDEQQPADQAHWIEYNNEYWLTCSKCSNSVDFLCFESKTVAGNLMRTATYPHYCPYCGSHMYNDSEKVISVTVVESEKRTILDLDGNPYTPYTTR